MTGLSELCCNSEGKRGFVDTFARAESASCPATVLHEEEEVRSPVVASSRQREIKVDSIRTFADSGSTGIRMLTAYPCLMK